MKYAQFLAALLMLGSLNTYAQLPEVVEGDFEVLRSMDTVSLSLHTDGMTTNPKWEDVQKATFPSADTNWDKSWSSLKDSLALKNFSKGFNDYNKPFKGPIAKTSTEKEYEYLMIVSIRHIAFNLGPSKPLVIDLEYILVDSKTKRNQQSRYYHKTVSSSVQGTPAEELESAFYNAGVTLAKILFKPVEDKVEE